MPEIEKEETQEELGWEDLTAHGDGRSETLEEEAPVVQEPAKEGEQAQAAETPVETPPEPPVAGVPTEPVAEGAEQKEGETEEQTWTLDGGRVVTAAEIAADPTLITQIVTRSNQTSNFQRLAEEREQHRLQTEAENRRLLDQYTAWQIQTEQAAQFAQAAPLPQRPEPKVIEGAYSGHLDRLVSDGRLTEDQRTEFGNVISEYMFDQQNTVNLINNIVALGQERLLNVEHQIAGTVMPDLQQRYHQDVLNMDYYVQQELASRPGYESLANPDDWTRLKLFVSEKVNASPRGEDGRPIFDPVFDPDTMAQLFDAMTGPDLRAQLEAQKAAQEEAAKQAAALASGETTARAVTPPQQKQPSKLTPKEEAMDFSDPRLATG